MIGLGSNRLSVCRRGGMSVTQAGRGGMEWLGVRDPIWAQWWLPYSRQAGEALKAAFTAAQWQTIKAYGFAHPEIVPYVNEDPIFIASYMEGTISYYLSGKDELVSGKWVDRIVPTIQWTPYGTCSRSGNGYTLDKTSAYLKTTNGAAYNLGNHFKVVVKFVATSDSFTIDFGSITAAQKNTSFQKGSMNWKMMGNDSNPGVTVTVPTIAGAEHILVWEIVDAGNGYDKFVFLVDETSYQTGGIIPKATNFNGYKDWDNTEFYIGRGVVDRAEFGCQGIIKEFVIYVID